jgi:hypothetical protein
MRQSISTTSGRNAAACSTPSAPSAASPTTSMPASSSNARRIRRMAGESSTSSTRGILAGYLPASGWSADPDSGAPGRRWSWPAAGLHW